jgi:hypothetical protein
MKNNPIIINEANLQRLETKYAAMVTAIDNARGKVTKWGTTPESQANVSKPPLPLYIGGAHFDEGSDLRNAVEKVRSGLVERLTGARKDIEDLQYAVKWLLADSFAVEHLSTLTSADFRHFIPTSTSPPAK